MKASLTTYGPPVLPPPTSTPSTLIPYPPTSFHPASTPTVSKSCLHLTFDNSKENCMIIIVSFNLICFKLSLLLYVGVVPLDLKPEGPTITCGTAIRAGNR